MATTSVAAAKNQFSDLLRRAEYGGERITVERHGKPVAVIVSTADLERLEALEDAGDLRDAAAALKEADEKGTIPLHVVLHKHGLDHLLIRRKSRSAGRKQTAAARSRGRTGRKRAVAASKKRRGR